MILILKSGMQSSVFCVGEARYGTILGFKQKVSSITIGVYRVVCPTVIRTATCQMEELRVANRRDHSNSNVDGLGLEGHSDFMAASMSGS